MGSARARIAFPREHDATIGNRERKELIANLKNSGETDRGRRRGLRWIGLGAYLGSSRRDLDEECGRLPCESRPSRRDASRGSLAVAVSVVVILFFSTGS